MNKCSLYVTNIYVYFVWSKDKSWMSNLVINFDELNNREEFKISLENTNITTTYETFYRRMKLTSKKKYSKE